MGTLAASCSGDLLYLKGWRLVVGGGWWWLAAVGGPWGFSLEAVRSKKKKTGFLRTALAQRGAPLNPEVKVNVECLMWPQTPNSMQHVQHWSMSCCDRCARHPSLIPSKGDSL